jgi:hypothetical protein
VVGQHILLGPDGPSCCPGFVYATAHLPHLCDERIRARIRSGVGACSMTAEMSQWKLPGIHLTKGDPSLCK